MGSGGCIRGVVRRWREVSGVRRRRLVRWIGGRREGGRGVGALRRSLLEEERRSRFVGLEAGYAAQALAVVWL